MIIDLARCIRHLRPEEEWSLSGESYAGLVWVSDTPKPTEAELLSAWEEIKDKVAWEPIRAERNRRLTASDWAMLPDAKVSKPYWENYRQALRDVPQRYATPEEVQWPQEPS